MHLMQRCLHRNSLHIFTTSWRLEYWPIPSTKTYCTYSLWHFNTLIATRHTQTHTCVYKGEPLIGHGDPQGAWGIYPFLTSALYIWGWSTPRSSHCTLGKQTRYPLYRRLGGPQGRPERVRKISSPPGFDHKTVQPVTSHYTDWAMYVCGYIVHLTACEVWTGAHFSIINIHSLQYVQVQ
jgi:hypothetical protein